MLVTFTIVLNEEIACADLQNEIKEEEKKMSMHRIELGTLRP